MSDYLPILQLTVSSLIIPAVAYIIRLERRIVELELKVDMLLGNITRRRFDARPEKG